MAKIKTPNPKMPGSRRMIGTTLQWKKAKQAAEDQAHVHPMPGEDAYKAGATRRGTGAVMEWAKAQTEAAASGHRLTVPGALMYRRGSRSAMALAWNWDRSREEAMARLRRVPIGFGRA